MGQGCVVKKVLAQQNWHKSDGEWEHSIFMCHDRYVFQNIVVLIPPLKAVRVFSRPLTFWLNASTCTQVASAKHLRVSNR